MLLFHRKIIDSPTPQAVAHEDEITTPEPAPDIVMAPAAPSGYHMEALWRVVDWLPPFSRIKQIAQDDLANVTEEDVEYLLKQIRGRHPGTSRKHLTAILLLGAVPLTEPQHREVVSICSEWVTTSTTADTNAAMARWVGSAVAVGIATPFFGRPYGGPGLNVAVGLIWALLLMVLDSPLWMLYEGVRWNKARVAYARTLGQLRSPVGVAPLLLAATSSLPAVRAASEESLETLLASIDVNSVAELPRPAMLACCRLLTGSRESLVLRLLDLLEQCGTGEAAQPVAELARRTASDCVRERAEAVLPILEERLREANNVAHLLRASAADAGVDTLLRAGEASQTSPAELLRATDVEG